MRLIIAGSRTYSDYRMMVEKIFNAFSGTDLIIISGGARGADELGERFARDYTLQLIRYPAEWDKYGKSAGYKRNEIMASNADALIAFWDGQSKGTGHMINLAKKYKLKIVVINF